MRATHAHPLRRLSRACRAGGLAGLLAGLALVAASPARAGDPTPTTKAVTLATPGVVFISAAADIPVHVTTPELQQLLGTSTVRGIRTPERSAGSGFVVNPKGTVVTASHVISFTDEDQQKLKTYAVNRLFFGELQRYHHERPGRNPYERQSIQDPHWNDLLQFCYAEVFCQITPKPVVSVITPAGGDGARLRIVPAAIATSTDFAATDITILRADATNLPTAPLAKTTGDLQPGQPIIALGFPGSADEMLKSGRTEATPVFGQISSVRARKEGSGQVVQVDAQLESGFSGSPVLDAEGKVLGLISFTGIDSKTLQRTQGYVRTIDDIHDALKTVGASAESGEVDTLFAQAMNDYWTHHYSAAVSLYQRVLNLSDGHLLARRYLTEAQAKADGPEDVPMPRPTAAGASQDSRAGMETFALALLAILIVALLLLLALPVVTWLRRRPVRLARGTAGWRMAAAGSEGSDEPAAPVNDTPPFGDGQGAAARVAGPAAAEDAGTA